MQREIPLIIKKYVQGNPQYDVCKDGLQFLRRFFTKKLRIILNITNQKQCLGQFNSWLLGYSQDSSEDICIDACLSISSSIKQISQERVILVLNAYQTSSEEPFMVLLGYLACSLIIYHHNSQDLAVSSNLTQLLTRLKKLLASTDINALQPISQSRNKQIKFKTGYAKTPFFLCLLPQKYSNTEQDPFKQFYKFKNGGNEMINESVDTLIQYFPQRKSLSSNLQKQIVSEIGKQFQQTLLGRQIFNFQLTGSTIENLCFQCCEMFNEAKPLSLNIMYHKIIENQKARLESEAFQRYLAKISQAFFGGKVIDLAKCQNFPISPYLLLKKHCQIEREVLQFSIKMAAYCMDINEYQIIKSSLLNKMKNMLQQLQQINNQKVDVFCRQGFQLLENMQIPEIIGENVEDIFRVVINKLQLYSNECCKGLEGDLSLITIGNYFERLAQKLLENLSENFKISFQQNQHRLQQYKIDKQDLKHSTRLLQTKLKQLQFQYSVQKDILNEYQQRIKNNSDTNIVKSNYPPHSQQLLKLRKRIQQLQQMAQNHESQIEQLSGIIEKFEGLPQKIRPKYKFCKQITDMIKQVSNELNICYKFLKEAKTTNQVQDQIKQGFSKQRHQIFQQKRKAAQIVAMKQAEFKKLISQKRMLEQVIQQAREGIKVYKQVDEDYKKSISGLENTYTQAHCLLAQTENQLQLFKKAISLISEQQIKGGKSESLNKFYNVLMVKELKDLMKPFIKR